MKTRFLSLLCAFITTAAFAEPLERVTLTGITLNVAPVASKVVSENKFKTSYGSSDIQTQRSQSIAGTVTNGTKQPVKLMVEIHWIGKKTGGNDRVWLPASESREITLEPRGVHQIANSSGTVSAQDLKLVAIGERYTGGARIEGWVVTVRWNEKLVCIRGNQAHLEDLVRSGVKLPMAEE